ncbi:MULTISPECIES: carbohydrate ABC transporter permease [unclassified Rhizobium]|uniref:carbohydrate ABC transporter permease n=1 Tax=unclassified Rhizobium TaxID=2613769 RepID=UPI001AD9976E|nr:MULTISPECIES: carbohydrate ABC transporter permease [unclassified Rhizobium]MBO9123804.1 carbohydrate ABC transporter permease [Rhizobium sp. 16-488-2b]MBO9174336.1 carbohydrate ABC transporter permease [Rhizobium sp. 16-488-2a]
MKRSYTQEVMLDCLTVLALGLMLLPILWVFIASIKPDQDIMSGSLIAGSFTLKHFEAILARSDFLVALRNSLIVGAVTAVATLILAVPSAYSLSRFKYLGRDIIGFLILGTQMLPAVAVIVPIVMIARSLGLTNSLGALAFIHLSLGLPIAVWMLKGYVDSVPVELEEAALIDGCSRLGALYRITFPLIRPAVVAVGTFAFVLSWGEFLMALSLITKVEVKTLPLALQTLFDPYSFSWGEVMAGGVVIAAPVVILFLMFRNQIVGGLSAGGVKG